MIEDLSVGSDTPIFDEAHVASDSTSDDVNELVESNRSAQQVNRFSLS